MGGKPTRAQLEAARLYIILAQPLGIRRWPLVVRQVFLAPLGLTYNRLMMNRTPSKFVVSARTFMVCFGLIGVSPAFAHNIQAAENDAILVTGIREEEKVIDAYLNELSDVDPQSPMARYEPNQYCAKVLGLNAKLNAEIASRMQQVAQAAGVRPAGPDCRTSALVIFADDNDTLQKAFRKEHPEYFQELSGETINYQGRGTKVLSWKVIGRLDKNLIPVGTDNDGVQIVNVGVTSSRLQMASRPVVAMSVLLIQRRAVAGLTTRQIADYALMRTLSETEPSNLTHTAPTILRVIDAPEGTATPLSLTDWDLTYVKGRYASNEWNRGYTQLAKIRAFMRQELLSIPDPDETE